MNQALSPEAFRARVAELHALLNELNIEHVFLKTVKPYPYADSNVDVLIPDRLQAQQLVYELKAQSFRPVFTLEPDKSMLLPPFGSSNSVAVHIYRTISWYTVPYLDGHTVLARSVTAHWESLTIPVPALADEFLIGALHAFFEQEALTWGDVWHLSALQQRLNCDKLLTQLESLTVRWVFALVWKAVQRLSASSPAPAMRNSGQERTVAFKFTERYILQGFLQKVKEELQRGHLTRLPAMLYAYGMIHPAKRLRLIRG